MHPDLEGLTEEYLKKIDEEVVARFTPDLFARRMIENWKTLAADLTDRLKKLNLQRGAFAGKSEEEQKEILGEETFKLMQEYLNHPLSQEEESGKAEA